MERIIAVFFCVCILLTSGCSSSGHLILIPDDVVSVRIAPYGSDKLAFKYTSYEKVQAVVEYIKGLNLIKTQKNQEDYDGMGYTIILTSIYGTDTAYYHYGNIFFRQDGGKWFELSYEQADAFNTLIKTYKADIPAP